MNQDIILQLDTITKAFDDTQVLRGIDLNIHRGEFITLLGPSGCGKTTTLRIISGLEIPDCGRVLLEGRDVTSADPNKRDVNTVFQNYALFPHMNVEANIGYSLKLKRSPKQEIRHAVKEALELVQLEGYEKRMPGELSGGQRQRVAIARAVVNKPKILLLDEPLGALDLQLRHQMQVELKRLQKQLGITFVYITHDQEEALNMSDRIAVMRDGLFEQIGSPAEIYDRPLTSFVASFVGGANIVSGTAQAVGEDTVLLRSSSGAVPVLRRGASIKAGDAATVAVRGEQIEIAKTADLQTTDGLSGVVKEKNFAGGMLRICVYLEGTGEVIVCRHGINSELEPGDSVVLSWLPENAVLIDLGVES